MAGDGEAEPLKSLEEAKEAVEDAKNRGDQQAEAKAMLGLAEVQLQKQMLMDAHSSARAARVLFRKAGDAKQEAEALKLGVDSLVAVGDLEEATREAYDALSVCRRAGDEPAEAAALAVVSKVHYQALSKDKRAGLKTDVEVDALREGCKELQTTANEACKVYGKLGDQSGLAQAYLALARVYILSDEPDAANATAKKAYAIYTDLKDGNGYYDSCLCIANAHIQRGDYSSAMRYANEARDLTWEYQDPDAMGAVEDLIGAIKQLIYTRNSLKKNKPPGLNLDMMSVLLS